MNWYGFLAALVTLKDYEGGSNPILAVLFIGLIVFGLLAGISFAIWKMYKTIRFNHLCTTSRLSSNEISTLKTFMRRMHIKEPLDVVTRKKRFDDFMNRIGHFYEGLTLSEDALCQEEDVFRNIRNKLQMPHNWRSKHLHTSRCLPVNYPLSLICWDEETQNIFRFNTRVLESNEFYLGIAPPDQKISSELFQQRCHVEAAFTREKDAEYMFDSHLVRTVDHPKTMWYIAHSKELIKGNPVEPVAISALVMVADLEDPSRVGEFNVMLHNLSNKGCTFRCDDKDHPFDSGPRILISFEIPQGSFTLRGNLLNIIKRNGELLHRVAFHDVGEEDSLTLLRFMLDLRAEKKKAKKEAQPSVATV